MKQLIFSFLIMWSLSASAEPATLVFDIANNITISSTGQDNQRPIASLTKLMTAMVVIDSNQSMGELIDISRQIRTVLPQKKYSRLELLYAMLIRSDNAAAETLASNHPGGRSAFIRAMNAKAQALGLDHTQFVDPSGLGVFNISTLQQVVIMLKHANRYEIIRAISTLKQAQLASSSKNQSIHFLNTNFDLLSKFKDIVVSKTGYTIPAGFCMGLVINRQGREFVVVVLGERNKQNRAATVSKILNNIV